MANAGTGELQTPSASCGADATPAGGLTGWSLINVHLLPNVRKSHLPLGHSQHEDYRRTSFETICIETYRIDSANTSSTVYTRN